MVKFAIYNTKIGYLKISYIENKITRIAKESPPILDFGKRSDLSDDAIEQIDEYLEGKRRTFSFPIFIEGTEFQKKVWRQISMIPYGKTASYKHIAELIGNPKAARAIGNANNKNPLAIIIPCHRIIGANGNLTGYAWGLETKAKLLDIEKENS